MTDREALKLALEALESKYIVGCGAWRVQQDQAITAIKEALAQPAVINMETFVGSGKAVVLAQPAQEPVAYRVKWPAIEGGHKWIMVDKPLMEKSGFVNEALYTTPQQRPWVGLAEEDRLCAKYMQDAPDGIEAVIDYIEAKLKEMNHG